MFSRCERKIWLRYGAVESFRRRNKRTKAKNKTLPGSFHSRGLPAPSILRKTRLRLNPATWISSHLRMFECLRKCVRRIPAGVVTVREAAFHQFAASSE